MVVEKKGSKFAGICRNADISLVPALHDSYPNTDAIPRRVGTATGVLLGPALIWF
jgi:hypothetical protein